MPGPWGKALRRLMADHRKSQIAVARGAGISKNTVGSVAKGRHTETAILQKLADYFGVPIEDVLMSGSDIGNPRAIDRHTESQGVASHVHGATLSHAASVDELNELRAEVRALQDELATRFAEHGASGERLSTPRARKRARPAHAGAARHETAHRDTPARKKSR